MKVNERFWVRLIIIMVCVFITIGLRVYCICELNDPQTAFIFDIIGVCGAIFCAVDTSLHLP